MNTKETVVQQALNSALKVQPVELVESDRQQYIEAIAEKLERQNAVLVAHYYTHADVQAVAELTGGCVADSLEMARFGKHADASNLIVAGVKFMGETAKILSPEKRVFMPTLEATCSLDLGCPIDEFSVFCDAHPERKVVVYANTSCAVKARSDWVVTSSIALDVVDYLDSEGHSIIWAPDKHLGRYIQQRTGADMLLWDGSCIVHEEFKAQGLKDLKAVHPEAAVLVHPESPMPVIELADVVGSTSQLIKAAQTLPNETCIVATDRGIFYKMQQAAPEKRLLEAPTAGHGATCKSCAHCPWMAMNDLEKIDRCLDQLTEEVILDAGLIAKAVVPLERMLSFKAP